MNPIATSKIGRSTVITLEEEKKRNSNRISHDDIHYGPDLNTHYFVAKDMSQNKFSIKKF